MNNVVDCQASKHYHRHGLRDHELIPLEYHNGDHTGRHDTDAEEGHKSDEDIANDQEHNNERKAKGNGDASNGEFLQLFFRLLLDEKFTDVFDCLEPGRSSFLIIPDETVSTLIQIILGTQVFPRFALGCCSDLEILDFVVDGTGLRLALAP